MADVTVYIPTRNRARLVAQAVASVMAQTHQDWRCIIVDDASDDETPRVLAGLAAADPRISYFRHEAPQGACAARNRAIEAAKTEFVTGLDDDDIFLPQRLAQLLEGVAKGAPIVTSRDLLWKGGRIKAMPKPDVATLPMMLKRNVIGNQILTRREHVLAVGGFDTALPSWQDYDLWVRLIERFGPVTVVPHFGQIIYGSDSVARITDDVSRQARGMELFFAKHGPKMNAQARSIHLARQKRLKGEPEAIMHALRGFDASVDGLRDVFWAMRNYRQALALR